MTKLVAYKKGTPESTEPASGKTQRIDFKRPDVQLTPWQQTAYDIGDITPDIICFITETFQK